MKNILLAIATFGLLFNQVLVANAASLNTHPTGPGLSCGKPNQVTVRSNPLACINHYEISGYCTQGREGPGGNPYTQIEAGRAIYTVTSDWNGYSQEFTQHFSLSGSYFKNGDKDTGTVVSHCSDDPMLNKVSCKTDPIVWALSGKSNYHNPGLRGLFPLTDIGKSSAQLRKMLMANSSGPQITAPKEYQKLKNHRVLIVLKAALPCGMGSSAKTATLMIQKEYNVQSAAKGWVYEKWASSPSRKVKITNNGGILKLSDLSSGRWRVRAQVASPIKGTVGDWREFTILGPTGISTFHNGAGAVSGKAPSKHFSGQQFGQQSNQQSSQNTKIRLGTKIGHGTAAQARLPAVQQHAVSHNKVRLGGRLNSKLALEHQAPAMHTMSGHLNSNGAPKRSARAGSATAHRTPIVVPLLKLQTTNERVDPACANLAKFITLSETVTNEGGPLAAGRAHLVVKEAGGAYIHSQSVPVPALAHGASKTVILRAGTQGAYRGKIPGRHVLSVDMLVNGRTTTTSKLTQSFRPGMCRVQHVGLPRHTDMKMRIKLNPQPEPPSRR